MATSNKIRALNRLPFDFDDGLKIGGVDVSSLNQVFGPGGAALIGMTPVGGLNSANVQAALAELDAEKARLDALSAATNTFGSSMVGHDGTTVKAVLDKAYSLADYTALRAYTGTATHVRITSNGISGFFYYDPTDTASADNGGTIIVSGTKRWKRQYEGAVSVKWFGAMGDWNGVTGTDDYLAITAAILYAKTIGRSVEFGGKHLSSGKILVSSGVSLKGASKRHLDSGRDADIYYSGTDAAIEINNVSEGSFQHQAQIKDLYVAYVGGGLTAVGLRQTMSSVYAENVRFFDFPGDGWSIGTCIFSTYINPYAFNCGGTGMRFSSEDPTYPGGQAIIINPNIQRCNRGITFENYQTTRVIGGTVALNKMEQTQILGGSGVFFEGTFIEPTLGNERTYYDKLNEIGSVTKNGTRINSVNSGYYGCYNDAGQSGATPRYNYGVFISNCRNPVIKNNSFEGFRGSAIKLVFDTDVILQYDIGFNHYTDCIADFDRTGSSSQGIDTHSNVTTYTNHGLTMNGTAKLTVQGTHTAPLGMGSLNLWTDPDSKVLRKSGAPASSTDGTSVGFGSTQGTVGAAGAAAALPATPTGYVTIRHGGNEYVIPYYQKS